MFEYIISIIIFIFICIVGIIYYNFSKSRREAKEAFLVVEILMKKRWDLIPSFVEVVKKYPVYDQKILQNLMKLREDKYNMLNMKQKIEADKNISKVVLKMLQIAENYSDLNSDEQYIMIATELIELEANIEKAWENYNFLVNKYNTQIEVSPKNLVAILFGFNEEKI